MISSHATPPAGPQLTAVSVCTKGGRSCFERRLKRLIVDNPLCLIWRSQSRDIKFRDAACGAPGDCRLRVHQMRRFEPRDAANATEATQSLCVPVRRPKAPVDGIRARDPVLPSVPLFDPKSLSPVLTRPALRLLR